MQLASVTVLGHGIGKLGNDDEFVKSVLNAFRDQYDRERAAFVRANERLVRGLDAFLEDKFGELSRYPEIRERQLRKYRGYMSDDLKNITPYGLLDK